MFICTDQRRQVRLPLLPNPMKEESGFSWFFRGEPCRIRLHLGCSAVRPRYKRGFSRASALASDPVMENRSLMSEGPKEMRMGESAG